MLENILSPKNIKALDISDLPQLCQEARQYLIDIVSEVGGHFSSGLGVVELTVALHYVFDTPNDKLVWDIGHQAYIHKILTGRKKHLSSIRKKGGISGFLKITESVYDSFGAGHSSTSISAAAGMAMAAKLRNDSDTKFIAIIGDAALASGMAFEALNHIATENINLIIILNDNHHAIDSISGALAKHLNTIEKNNNFFQNLNINYHGVFDGHDVQNLVKQLQHIKNLTGIQLVHIKTIKGKGFLPAETEQVKWHSTGKFDKITGQKYTSTLAPNGLSYQKVFGKTLLDLARNNAKIVAVTPAMITGSALTDFLEAFPNRVFDVGIAEQHAVTFSAGLANNGLKPYCVIYSTFLQRAYDQIIHDVALQNLPVVFCIDRAGLVGADGATHQGVFDIAFLRCIPNLIIAEGIDENEFRNLLFTAQFQRTPIAIRFKRGNGVCKSLNNTYQRMKIGKAEVLKEGKDIAILTFGHLGTVVQSIYKDLDNLGIKIFHANMRFAKPLDQDLLHNVGKHFKKVITIEDGVKHGGFGSAVAEFLTQNNYPCKIEILGVPDYFVEHASQAEQYETCHLDSESVLRIIQENMFDLPKSTPKKFNKNNYPFVIITQEMIDAAMALIPQTKVNRTVTSKIDTLTGHLGELVFAQWYYADWRKNNIAKNKGETDFEQIEIKTSAFPFNPYLNLLVREDYAKKRHPVVYIQIVIDVDDRQSGKIFPDTKAYLCGFVPHEQVAQAPLKDFGSKLNNEAGGYLCHYINIMELKPMEMLHQFLVTNS